MVLCHIKKGIYSHTRNPFILYFIQFYRSDKLILPKNEEKDTFKIISNATKALGFLDFFKNENQTRINYDKKFYKKIEEFFDKCKEIIFNATNSNAHVFNEIFSRESLLEVLITVDSTFANKLIQELFKKEIHFPQLIDTKGKNGENKTESALSIAIDNKKENIVQSLLKYYCNRAHENPISWMSTVVPVLSNLLEKYPGLILDLFKKISYMPVDDKIIRINQEELFAFQKPEQLNKVDEETTTWVRKYIKRVFFIYFLFKTSFLFFKKKNYHFNFHPNRTRCF